LPPRKRLSNKEIPPFEGEGTIIDTSVVDEIESSYLEYSYSVIYARALPDARDGMKPVHRRILYSMYDDGLRPERAHVKSARVVGSVMGRFHPHGDAAIYDAMVRLAQPFSMRVPLIDGHGNWGSPDDSPAAARYTEARLTPAAMAMVDGLTEETVDFEPNYDGSEQQPSVLPAAYPNLLVNGGSGIAVGMATNMIPHNLIETIDAAQHLLENPDASLDDLMRHLPGPDLPSGGQLLGMDEVRQAYETGRGVVRIRATAELGPLPRGKSAITVTELPYGVGAERVIAKVKELVNGKKLQGIADVKDLTDRSQGTQLVFEIKAGFNPQAVLAELYRLTPLEESFGINNLALVDGQPRTLGLIQMLQVFLDHRADVVTRRTRYRLRKAEERAHLVEGLLLALANIDEVVRIIRSSPDVAVARVALMDRFAFTDIQAGYVLDMQLRRLVALEVDKLEAELAELRATIAALLEILDDPEVLKRVISDELAEVAQEHGTARRTVLVGGDLKALVTRKASDLEVADAPCDVLLSSTGLLARTPVHEGESQPGGRRHRHDVILATARTRTRGHVGLLTSAGRLVRVGVLDIPEVPAVTTGAISLRGGASAAEFLSLDRGERVIGLATLREDGPGLALATKQGVVKRVAAESWPARGDAVDIISLKPGDEVVSGVELVDGTEELVFFASTGDLLRFPAELVRPQGRPASGMAGMKLDAGAVLVGFSAVALAGDTLFDEPVVVTAGGLPAESRPKAGAVGGAGVAVGVASSVKVTPLSEYPRKGRATGGVRCQRLLSGESMLVLGWAGVSPWAAAANGDPVELPPATGKRDGSGTPADKPVGAVGRAHS
jgi:DNA gyrase subunit A